MCASQNKDPTGEVYVLICGIDYSCDRVSWAGPPPAGHGPLDTKYAFDDMQQLVGQCENVVHTTTLWNEQCTAEGILAKIREIGSMVGEDDYFVFYYTGHGDQLMDDDGETGKDQCLCTVDATGATDGPQPNEQIRAQIWLRDDDFAQAFIESVGESGGNLLVLVDACHSSTICDFQENPRWAESDLKAVSMSGCQDNETSAGTGMGGMFSRSLMQAIQDLNDEGEEGFSVQEIYNKTLEHYQENKNFGHTQHIAIASNTVNYNDFAFPLNPGPGYVAPANQPSSRDVDLFGGSKPRPTFD